MRISGTRFLIYGFSRTGEEAMDGRALQDLAAELLPDRLEGPLTQDSIDGYEDVNGCPYGLDALLADLLNAQLCRITGTDPHDMENPLAALFEVGDYDDNPALPWVGITSTMVLPFQVEGAHLNRILDGGPLLKKAADDAADRILGSVFPDGDVKPVIDDIAYAYND